MINSCSLGKSYCPMLYFDATTVAAYGAAVDLLMADWEQFLFDNLGITGDYQNTPPKSEQVDDDTS